MSGSGSDSPNSGLPGTVKGEVWLDNNGDGLINNNEMGYVGATVTLCYYDNGAWELFATTTTNGNRYGVNYSMQITVPYPNSEFELQVVFPWSFEATKQGGNSQINDQGYTQPFYLSPGGTVQETGGLRSMNVNTLSDDPYGPTQQNTVTLRDAIETGNNGPPNYAVTFIRDPQGDPGSGTISLLSALDPISTSFNVAGPGSSLLTINANGNAANPRRVFSVNAGATSTINGLTLKGGYESFGGCIDNSGMLTLEDDSLLNNPATNGGGAIFNSNGASLSMTGVLVDSNSTDGSGGGILNYGKFGCSESSITNNKTNNGALGNGGGLAAYSTSTEPSKVRFDQLKLTQSKNKE